MLKSKLEINSELLEKNHDKINSILENNKIKDLNSLVNNIDWINEYKESNVKDLIYQLSKIDNLISIEIIDSNTEIEYDNYDTIKKLFLIYLSEKWESAISVANASNTLKEVDVVEGKFDKSAIEFDCEEMRKTVIDLFSDMKYHKLRYQVNILTRMQNFYGKQFLNKDNWAHFKKTDVLKEIIGNDAREHVLTKRDLINLTRIAPNAQDSIVPLLIFEGVSFSKKDDIDEIRYLKKTDLYGATLHIDKRDAENGYQREINLSVEVAELVDDAIQQNYAQKEVRGKVAITELEDTEYILRASRNSSKSSRKNGFKYKEEDVMSFTGVYSRINVCKELMESLLYDIPFTPTSIETSGKIYYISKFMNEGHEEVEAIIMTLKRFGNWYDDKGGKISPKNYQLINRLRKVWKIHS